MDWVLFYLVHMYGHLSTNLPIKHTAGPHLVVVAVRELVALGREAVERVREVLRVFISGVVGNQGWVGWLPIRWLLRLADQGRS